MSGHNPGSGSRDGQSAGQTLASVGSHMTGAGPSTACLGCAEVRGQVCPGHSPHGRAALDEPCLLNNMHTISDRITIRTILKKETLKIEFKKGKRKMIVMTSAKKE